MGQMSFSALLVNLALVIGLKLENVTVPQYSVKDGSASLFCDFQLDPSEKLYSLKWYKDTHEFYRYAPQIMQRPFLVFPVEGVYVNTTQSGLNHVLLKNITLKSSGNYKCEVTSATFRTLSQQGDMIVIAPPSADPEIFISNTGVHPAVSVGDTLSANCTSRNSQPAASLMFYVNEEKAEVGEMIEYLPVSEPSGLETSILGLHLEQLEPRHFKSGGLELKCTATIGNSYRVKKIAIAEANINAQPSIPGHNRSPLLSIGVNSAKESTLMMGSLVGILVWFI